MVIKNIHSLQTYLAAQTINDIFFAVTFPKDALGLEEIFPIKIISFDQHPIIDQIQTKTDIFSLLQTTKDDPKRRSTSVLLKHPQTVKYIESFSNRPANILVYKPSPSLSQICALHHWHLLANPPSLNREFENKINFSNIIQKLNLPQPTYEIKKFHDIKYDYFCQTFGPEFFIQFPRGFAGSSTFLIQSAPALQQLQKKFLNYPAKISRKINGPTYSLNAVIVNQDSVQQNVIVQKPFYQITNIPSLNPSAGGTCGNIYSSVNFTPYDLPAITNDAIKFGRLLEQNQYRGLFGLDFVVDEQTGQHYFIECNPRLTASIPMITKLQIQQDEVPLLALHLLEFLSLSYQLDPSVVEQINQHPDHGSQIIFRNTSSEPISTPIHYPSGIYSTSHPVTDIFQLQQLVSQQSDQIQFIRNGQDILDIQKKNEFLILCEPSDKIISPAIEYLRIQSLV
ncbi:MAG TPA: ATP-grasp domain-containing protein [bacterium]|nr:ATP-grasp domain-containing protein [bacterium]